MEINEISVKEVTINDIVVDLPENPLFHKIAKVKSITTYEENIFFNGFNGTTIRKNINDNINVIKEN